MPSRRETQVVLKYCEVIDEFIKVRVFEDDDVGEQIDPTSIVHRRDYQRSIVEAAVVDYKDTVLPLFQKFNRIYKPEALEDVLYQICVEVNPHLEIHQVSLPIDEEGEADGDGAAALRERLRRKAMGLERELMRRIVGQNRAVAAVAKAIKKAAVGLKDPRKPIGCFLLVGSTGSGKTELAKVVSEVLFERPDRLVRIDCSEFALPHEYAKLIGAPPGYIGHNDGGFLTEALKNKRECVVLFDEIEKAHHKIHNLLLQLMDEGTLTDGKGNTVRFDRALVLLTSNIGVAEVEGIRNRCGFDWRKRERLDTNDRERAFVEAMNKTFPPEFVNRLDDVIVFNVLTERDCRRIARLQLDQVSRYLSPSGPRLSFSPAVEARIAAWGYSEEYGARELRREIRTRIEVPLAEMLLTQKLGPDDTVRVGVRRGRIHFEVRRGRRPRSGRRAQSEPAATTDEG